MQWTTCYHPSSRCAWVLLAFFWLPLQCSAGDAYGSFIAPLVNTPPSMQKSTPIKIAITTWNLAESTPRVADCEFIKQFQDEDIVVIGVQECEDLRPRTSEGRRSLAWSVLQRYALGPEFVRLKKLRMGGIQLSVFASKNFSQEVQDVRGICVPCGIGNVMVNKGAVCAQISVRNTSIGLVNVHLAAHEHALQRRNEDYIRIKDKIGSTAEKYWNTKSVAHSAKRFVNRRRKLPVPLKKVVNNVRYRQKPALGSPSRLTNPSNPVEHVRSFAQNVLNMDSSTFDLALNDVIGVCDTRREFQTRQAATQLKHDSAQSPWPFDATFFFGDLNYRVEYPVGRKGYKLRRELNQLLAPEHNTDITEDNIAIKDRVISDLLKYDQLRREMKPSRGKVLKGFKEMPISFLPTYKYDKRVNKFDSSGKKRKPSYTDRILYNVRSITEESLRKDVDGNNAMNDSIDQRVAKTHERGVGVHPDEYWSVSSCRHGDHRPVCAKFKITI